MSDNEKTLALLAALAGVRTSGPRKVQRPRAADEIVRQRQRADRAERILAALREPSMAVWGAALDSYNRSSLLIAALSAAVAAAEREVDG